MTISRIDVASGRREAVKTLVPADPSSRIGRVVVTPDGHYYVFDEVSRLSNLYLVKGLR